VGDVECVHEDTGGCLGGAGGRSAEEEEEGWWGGLMGEGGVRDIDTTLKQNI
jgi:hypothetical protein